MAQTRILYVEDYPVVQLMYVEVLKKHFDVTVAADGKDALTKVEENIYDMILLDLLLPEVSGIEFLRAYRKMSKPTHAAKIVILSDFDSPEMRKQAAGFGVEHYWIKVETTPHVLIDKLQAILEKA